MVRTIVIDPAERAGTAGSDRTDVVVAPMRNGITVRGLRRGDGDHRNSRWSYREAGDAKRDRRLARTAVVERVHRQWGRTRSTRRHGLRDEPMERQRRVKRDHLPGDAKLGPVSPQQRGQILGAGGRRPAARSCTRRATTGRRRGCSGLPSADKVTSESDLSCYSIGSPFLELSPLAAYKPYTARRRKALIVTRRGVRQR